jgi:hypothetical protein
MFVYDSAILIDDLHALDFTGLSHIDEIQPILPLGSLDNIDVVALCLLAFLGCWRHF